MNQNTFHKKNDCPDCPGKYWVIVIEKDGEGEDFFADDGFAKWNGEKWNRVDFDLWYGQAKEKLNGMSKYSFLHKC